MDASNNAETARVALSMNEFCASLGVSRATAYRMADRGKLRLVKFAGRTLVPLTERDRLLSGDETQAERPRIRDTGACSPVSAPARRQLRPRLRFTEKTPSASDEAPPHAVRPPKGESTATFGTNCDAEIPSLLSP